MNAKTKYALGTALEIIGCIWSGLVVVGMIFRGLHITSTAYIWAASVLVVIVACHRVIYFRSRDMSDLLSMRRWYKCLFRRCSYYGLYTLLIVPRRLTHHEYHDASQRAWEHLLVDCPLCAAKQFCPTSEQWRALWKTD